jgi:hypothetical protein
MRSLVVEDDPAVREALRRALTLGSYDAQIAEDGERDGGAGVGEPSSRSCAWTRRARGARGGPLRGADTDGVPASSWPAPAS